MKKDRFILLIILLVTALPVFCQQVRVDAVLDTSRLRIGEQAKVDLYLSYDAKLKDLKIEWPSIGDTLSEKVEVISVSGIDTTFPNKTNSSRIFQHQQIVVSVYDSGFFAIPPLKFKLSGAANDSLFTKMLFLEVHTVPTDSSASKLKDIKQPLEEKFNWKWYLKYIYWSIGVVVLLGIIIGLTIYYTRKKQQVPLAPPKPKIPAHITALGTLERIRDEAVWKEGRTKEYYSLISDTIRLYIEERFGLNALESTTDEIMTAFRSQVVDHESKEKLYQLLSLSDLVKFAKLSPIESEHLLTLQNGFDFVNGTKREETVTLQTDEAGNTETV